MELRFDALPASVAAGAKELRERALEETRRWLEVAAERWPAARGPVQVSFRLRGRCAGEACPKDGGSIRYNAALLERYGQAFLEEIVPHEVAHVVVSRLFEKRRRPHGPEWREVMRAFGVPARTCHAFETTPARRVARVAYRCACAEPHLLTLRAHRRFRRGTMNYYCRECRQLLVWMKP